MERERIDQALARLDAALVRVEGAAHKLAETRRVALADHGQLQQRHSQLKDSVAKSLRQLDEILAGIAQ